MSLTSRIELKGLEPSGPEDYLSTSLGVIFPDDVTNQHGDADHSLLYTSAHLPKQLHFVLADPPKDTDRRLFSHFLWNSSLLLAELLETDTLRLSEKEKNGGSLGNGVTFDVTGETCIELGAGTALPSVLAALLGAKAVTVTDYPSEFVMSVLRTNIKANITVEHSPTSEVPPQDSIIVEGHEWGSLTDSFTSAHIHAYTRVFVCDCLWMPWQHENLISSIAHFLSKEEEARAWVVAGFHTGRDKMGEFFKDEMLRKAGLELERIWERDCDGVEREWSWTRSEDPTARKRWLAIAVLKRSRVL